MVATMIRLGHTNCWDYPLGIFRSAVDELEQANGDH
jgi:hypothetical protein